VFGGALAGLVCAAFLSGDVVSRSAAEPAPQVDDESEGRWVVVRRVDGSLVVDVFEPGELGFGDAESYAAAGASDIVVSERDGRVEQSADFLRTLQWHLDTVAFEDIPETSDGAGVVVAVVDTAIALGHEDLGPTVPGWDAIEDRPFDPAEWETADADHGTHVATVLAAPRDNGRGGHGAAPGVQVMPVRVLQSNGGFVSDVVEGILWAIANDADVINLSLGTALDSGALRAAVAEAEAAGVVVIAASGNNGLAGSPIRYPAALDTVIAVGAVGPDLLRWPQSSLGAYLDVVAPGVDILSAGGTTVDEYRFLSGTSMATPQVAALVSLLVQADPNLTPGDVRDVLRSTARDLGDEGHDPEYGYGLIDPAAALDVLDPAITLDPPENEVPVEEPASVESGTRYWIVTDHGRVLPLTGTPAPAAPVVPAEHPLGEVIGGAPTSSGDGYWLVDTAGRVVAHGDAPHHGDASLIALNQPIVGMSATPSGGGYWLVALDGGVFAFGDAEFHGSTGGMVLNQPIVDMAVTATGDGYWLVAADGGVFAFGDAVFRGSTGALALNAPVVSMAAGVDGYWLVATDGGVFTFDVPYVGSIPGLGIPLETVAPGRRVRILDDGSGYVVLTADGALFGFGTAANIASSAPQLADGESAVDLLVVED